VLAQLLASGTRSPTGGQQEPSRGDCAGPCGYGCSRTLRHPAACEVQAPSARARKGPTQTEKAADGIFGIHRVVATPPRKHVPPQVLVQNGQSNPRDGTFAFGGRTGSTSIPSSLARATTSCQLPSANGVTAPTEQYSP
jgi:hypothetical protein